MCLCVFSYSSENNQKVKQSLIETIAEEFKDKYSPRKIRHQQNMQVLNSIISVICMLIPLQDLFIDTMKASKGYSMIASWADNKYQG